MFLRSPTRYPLVYRKRVRRVDDQARPGDLVAVYSEPEGERAELIGYGLYNPRSEIVVRLVRTSPELPDGAFWDQALARAVRLRRDVLRLDDVTDAYRVLHAEADGFSGLVVDRLGDTLSAEVFSLGMYQRCGEILTRLQPMCGTRHTLDPTRPARAVARGFCRRAAGPRPNCRRAWWFRSTARGFACTLSRVTRPGSSATSAKIAGSWPPTVRDVRCWTSAATPVDLRSRPSGLGKAAEVIGVDLDEQPLQLARDNAALNQVRVKFVQADVFPFMRDMLRSGRQFDVVVLDPPKLIRSRTEIRRGFAQVLRPESAGHAAGAAGRPAADLHLLRSHAARRIRAARYRRLPAGGAARSGRRRTSSGAGRHARCRSWPRPAPPPIIRSRHIVPKRSI